MLNRTPLLARKLTVLAAAAALGAGSLVTYVATAQERRAARAEQVVVTLSPAEQRSVLEHMTEAKRNAGDPKQADRIIAELSDLMIMDEVARSIAADPGVRQQHAAEMTDSALKRVHAEAVRIATDPKVVEKRTREIMADPAALKVVLHQAEIIQMTEPSAEVRGERR